MNHDRLYQITSIARPLEWKYPTNRAVILLLPVGALIMAIAGYAQGHEPLQIAWSALTGAVVVFGSWALARELAPDDNAAAFISMFLAFATLRFDIPSLLFLFTALFMVRMVNRSTGLPARYLDSFLVLGLTFWAAWEMETPGLCLVAALAFVLDGQLRDGQRHQWGFAFISIAGAIYVYDRFGMGGADPEAFSTLDTWLIASVTIVYVAIALLLHRVRSVGDATGLPLSTSRVRAAMFIGLLAASQALVHGAEGFERVSLVWATLAGVALGGIGRMLFVSTPDD